MKKNRIRLTESKLHGIIKESVKRVLKETYSYLDPYEDLDPYDYERMMYNDYHARGEEAYSDIMNGVYDDLVPQWADEERCVYDDLNLDVDYSDDIMDAVLDRLFIIDKSAALKYGKNPSDYPRNKKYSETRYPKDGNPNIKDYNRYYSDALSDESWEDKENRDYAKKYPHSFKKNGEWRYYDYENGGGFTNHRKISDNLAKDLIGTDQADKRPLHRKGSLNRALDESIRRAIRKMLR